MPPFVGLSLRCDTALVTGRRYAVLTITERRDTPLRRSMARNHRKCNSGIRTPVLGLLAKTPDMPLAAVGKHLAVLEESWVVHTRKQGRRRHLAGARSALC